METPPEAMEDYNIPSPERVALLAHLQEAIGDVPPHFWAACQVCELKALEMFIECGCISPPVLRVFAEEAIKMADYCKQSSLVSLSLTENS